MLKHGYVYIVSNKNCTVLYTGVTADLKKRILQHKGGSGSVFTSRYYLADLLYYEELFSMDSAIKREKQVKRWHRDWKINLIKSINPEMKDLFDEL